METKRTILIIDDDDFTREMYANVFRNSDFEVLEAHDGVEGLDTATEKLPDMIFSGIVMPRMDGFSLMEALQKHTPTASIPVVISSHLGRTEDRKRADQLGAKGFIVRDTTTPREVVKIISNLFTEGGEYVLEFDPYALDGQRMAQQLRMNSHYQCMDCGEKMVLKIRVAKQDGWFQAKFVCPKCGWQVP
jgi:CheY-like chemotaxis protein/predicted RNA-binding Zn-ribbon protein involved in translation (DUF1610 family)